MSSRQAVRVLLFDEADGVLLVRFSDGDRSWWCTPGGGIEPGETDEKAARRELREEPVEALLEHSHDDIRWWTTDELATGEHQFGPRRLPALVHELLRNGPPPAPIDVGV